MVRYVNIPKNLRDVPEKFIFGLTKRQVICFGIGIALGFPIYFLTRKALGMTFSLCLMGIVAAPFIVAGIYKKDGLFFEQKLKNMIAFFRKPRIRTYRCTNSFVVLQLKMEKAELEKQLRLSQKYEKM